MLYLVAIDDADTRHAVSSTAQPEPVCGTHTGRVRVLFTEHHHFDAASSTSITERRPEPAKNAASLEPKPCPGCADFLAPQKIRALAQPAAPENQAEPAKPVRTRKPRKTLDTQPKAQ
jgi:hypothetical protein